MSRDLPHAAGAKFDAKFDGRCKGCDTAVYAGDRMQYIDDEAVCEECGDAAVQANHEAVRASAERWRQEERAKDPEAWDRRQAAVKKWTDSVKARAAAENNREWVTAPGSTPGWVLNPDFEPSSEQDVTVTTETTIEPGIQALMAAGLLQGQEPGGDGICHATIEAAGIITEVDIPVPVDPPAAKTRAPRKSRAKAPAEALSVDIAEGPAAALAQQRERAAELQRAADSFNVQDVVPKCDAPGCTLLANHGGPHDPAPVIPTPSTAVDNSLQMALQSSIDSGVMTPEVAASLGWVPPGVAVMDPEPASPWVDPAPDYHSTQPAQPAAATPRTREPLAEFTADPSTPRASLFLDALAGARSVAEEDAILAALDELPAYVGGANRTGLKAELLGIITSAIDNHPRSQQKRIGPSEIGTECDHCLAAKLAEWDQVERGAWLPTVGTAVHSWIQEAIEAHPEGPRGTRRFLAERRVLVGTIDGVEITGSTDLVDTVAGWTWDWKIVGATTLKSAKVGPSRQYVVQQMLYGRGWNMLGVKVTHVGIAYLPRNAVSLQSSVFWSMPYDEKIATDALERADAMARNLRALAALGTEVRDNYITGLPRWRSSRQPVNGVEQLVEGNSHEGAITCHDCPRYADYPADPAEALKQLDGLL
jgi:hypothetical protein